MKTMIAFFILFISFQAKAVILEVDSTRPGLISFDPHLHYGLGVKFVENPFDTDTYGLFSLKFSAIDFGDGEKGLHLLELGGAIDSTGKLGLLLMPATFFYDVFSIGPGVIFRQGERDAYTITFAYRFY